MIKKNFSPRRLIITVIGFILTVFSMYLSQKALSFLERAMQDTFQYLIFIIVAGLVGIGVLTVLYKPLSRLLRELLDGSTPLISKSAIVSYGLIILFNLAMGIVILTFTGFVIYVAFGG